jgi:hypothetical protein
MTNYLEQYHEAGENDIISFHQTLIGLPQHTWERSEMHTKFCWSESLKRTDLSEDLSIEGKIILKWTLLK